MFTLTVTCGILLAALLKTIGRGGDWFDLLQRDVHYENQRTDFEFKAMFAVMCALLIGGAAFLIFMSLKNDQVKPVFITDLDPSVNVAEKHHTAVHPTPVHAATAKHHHR